MKGNIKVCLFKYNNFKILIQSQYEAYFHFWLFYSFKPLHYKGK